MNTARHLTYHDLLKGFGGPGCAVCTLGRSSADRALSGLTGEAVTDVDAREKWRASFGTCPAHARELLASAQRLPLAILFEDLLRILDTEMGQVSWRNRRRDQPCPVCTAATDQEDRAVGVLAEALSAGEPDQALADAYRASPGLCRPHILALIRRLRGSARQLVIQQERSRIGALRRELLEVVRKHDHRANAEAWGDERTAPERAGWKLAGGWGQEGEAAME